MLSDAFSLVFGSLLGLAAGTFVLLLPIVVLGKIAGKKTKTKLDAALEKIISNDDNK